MDDIVKRVSEHLAEHSSRRTFVGTLGKMVVGAAAILTGQSFFASPVLAQKHDSLKCCSHTNVVVCDTAACPAGSTVQYTWTCGGHTTCNDCFDSAGHPVCTYTT
jgi:hypothetical protein